MGTGIATILSRNTPIMVRVQPYAGPPAKWENKIIISKGKILDHAPLPCGRGNDQDKTIPFAGIQEAV